MGRTQFTLDDQEKETDESDNVAKFDEFFEADDE